MILFFVSSPPSSVVVILYLHTSYSALGICTMALRGVWQLRELAIRYSLGGGSSRGVRDFVENGLVDFAKKNPHISITTKLEPGHPTVQGKYRTLYIYSLLL